MSNSAKQAGARNEVAGALYVVAMPIGNLGDISARALSVLRGAGLIACEDTRRTGRLLAAHQIRTPMVSYFEHNEERRTPELIERMRTGTSVALLTDAGTPAISDPGFRLVRAAHREGIRVAAVPGASAVIAALSIAGLPTDRFTFEGFVPAREGARRAALAELRAESRTMVFFEAARRLGATLVEMAAAFGPRREAAVVREATKSFEETVRGGLGELAARFSSAPARGEVTLVVAGAPDSARTGAAPATAINVEELVEAGLSLKQASALMARLTGGSRREFYQAALKARMAR